MKETIARNLRQPTGFLGKITGLMMNKGNDYMNRFTLNFLDAQSSDRILEIGFGNGKYITELARIAQNGQVCGVDYSETMVQQAIKRNKSFIDRGVVEIKRGEVSKIPFDNESFNKVFTVNTLYFWPNPSKDVQELHRILKPSGKLIITFRSKENMESLGFTKHGFTLYEPQQVIDLVKSAGFRDIRLQSAANRTKDVNCVIAVK